MYLSHLISLTDQQGEQKLSVPLPKTPHWRFGFAPSHSLPIEQLSRFTLSARDYYAKIPALSDAAYSQISW